MTKLEISKLKTSIFKIKIILFFQSMLHLKHRYFPFIKHKFQNEFYLSRLKLNYNFIISQIDVPFIGLLKKISKWEL